MLHGDASQGLNSEGNFVIPYNLHFRAVNGRPPKLTPEFLRDAIREMYLQYGVDAKTANALSKKALGHRGTKIEIGWIRPLALLSGNA